MYPVPVLLRLTLITAAPFILATACSSNAFAPGKAASVSQATLNVRNDGQGLLAQFIGPNISVRVDRRPSWMMPSAKHEKLLYVSDAGTDDVNVYSYLDGKLVGQLTGFNQPRGECVDLAGNVYISNTLDSNILEYAHGGTVPIATLADPGEYPVDCVYDKGAIALANIESTNGGPGSVSFYYNGAIQGTWVDPDISQMYFIGHVGKDRGVPYFVDGISSAGVFEYAKFNDGRFTSIRLAAPIKTPGAIQWFGKRKFISVGDQAGNVYKTQGGNVLGKTSLDGLCSLGQFFITKSKVIAPDPCGSKVGVYAYPAGGKPIKTIAEALSEPVGSALSLAQSP